MLFHPPLELHSVCDAHTCDGGATLDGASMSLVLALFSWRALSPHNSHIHTHTCPSPTPSAPRNILFPDTPLFSRAVQGTAPKSSS